MYLCEWNAFNLWLKSYYNESTYLYIKDRWPGTNIYFPCALKKTNVGKSPVEAFFPTPLALSKWLISTEEVYQTRSYQEITHFKCIGSMRTI